MRYLTTNRVRALEPGDVIKWRGRWRRVVACWPVDHEMTGLPFGTYRLRLERDGRVRVYDVPGSRKVRRREYAPAVA